MDDTINISDIYDKNLNFLIGSGASYGLLPTLALALQKTEGAAHTIETLATLFEDAKDERITPLFMHYYLACIEPALRFKIADVEADATKKKVVSNYEIFISTLLTILQRRKPFNRTCNLFTTNYDGCFSLTADELLRKANIDFVLNDGARGYSRRYLQARNYNTYLCQTGIFERHTTSIPQINLIHLHGSVYWNKEAANIFVDYQQTIQEELLPASIRARLEPFSKSLMDPSSTVDDLKLVVMSDQEKSAFWDAYKKLPIVNPTKWKFHETVFEEHYYQMLRMLSYELEKPNSVLITFGFSFADEHILSLIKRSVSNPKLQIFVCCFDASEFERLSEEFKMHGNVKCISTSSGVLDFTEFNEGTFSLASSVQSPAPPSTDSNLPSGGAA